MVPAPPGWEGMPRYFFHVIRGDAVYLQDEVGLELPSDEVAVQGAIEVAQEEDLSTEEIDSDGFRVVDESGRIVAFLHFRTLQIEGTLHSVVAALTLLGLSAAGFLQQLPEVLA